MKRRIVCAANKHHQLIVLGVRHFDDRMRDVMEELSIPTKSPKWIQGFVDNRGQFHDRRSAFKIAQAAGQIVKKTGCVEIEELYSEDLY